MQIFCCISLHIDILLYLFSVVVAVEVSNKSISQMRTDYFKYFNEETLLGVIGVKFFGTGKWIYFVIIL